MNDRILELAKQAGLQPYYDAQEQHIQKFAELIVAECANIDFRHKCWLAHESDYEVSRAIREHFGVES